MPVKMLLKQIAWSWVLVVVWMGRWGCCAGDFRDRSYDEMVARLMELNQTYPEVIRVGVLQDMYNLTYPQSLICSEASEVAAQDNLCRQFVVHVTNHSTMPDEKRPEVFFSGALHGDERVGPATTIELIALLAKYATAVANGTYASNTTASVERSMQWIYGLVNTRSVYITPMTNAYGYAHHQREEMTVDPNRDYNYMAAPSCMKTMTARAVNELWRDHLFQLAVTFHGGMRAIGYEWGSPNHYLKEQEQVSQKSPDHTAQFNLANAMASYAGAFANGKQYPTGTMNDIVYGVTGGMEDWAYAASWENDFVGKDQKKPFQPCEPGSYGGYPKEKTVYNNLTHRAFNILVETSNSKGPKDEELGKASDIYDCDLDFFVPNINYTVGHIPRNIRLALLLVELVEPYVRWVDLRSSVASSQPRQLSEAQMTGREFVGVDAFQLESPSSLNCSSKDNNTVVIQCHSTSCTVQKSSSLRSRKIHLGWEVLGSFTVDETFLEFSATSDFAQIHNASMEKLNGQTRRALAASTTRAAHSIEDSLFVACVDVPKDLPPTFYVRVAAKVDQNWKNQGQGDDLPSPKAPPQSHVVNARTNTAWNAYWNGHRVEGRLYWYSPVITVTQSGSADEPTVRFPSSSSPASTMPLSEKGSSIPESKDTPTPSKPTDTPSGSVNPTATTDSTLETTPKTTSSAPTPTPSATKRDNSSSVQPPATASAPPIDVISVVPHTSVPKSPVVSEETSSKTHGVSQKASSYSNSLVSMGITVVLTGAVVVVGTLLFLYRRVFHRRTQRRYMNVNEQSLAQNDSTDGVESREDEDDHMQGRANQGTELRAL